VIPVTPEEAAAVKATLAEYGINNPKEADQPTLDLITSTPDDTVLTDAGFYARTASAVYVNYKLSPLEDSLIVGHVPLPANTESLSGEELPEVANLSEFLANYDVVKYFDEGATVVLNDEFSDILSFDEVYGYAELLPIVVIVDGEAPDDSDVVSAGEGYGVRLSGDKKTLIIYDGEEDGYATDPIASVKSEPTGGGGGCDAGFAGFGLIALALGAALSRKRG
jgi:hypothetical protein